MPCIGRLLPGVLALVMLAVPTAIQAQAYPGRTVRLILLFPPGGGTDTLGRGIAQTLSAQIGQQVVADNRPGAGGNLGLELASKAPPDGYTMVLSSPLVAISPMIYAKLNYDPEKDLAPVSMLGFTRKVLAVHPAVPARTLTNPELVKRLDSVGVETRTSTPEELGRFAKSESARFGKVIKSAGIKPI